MSHSAILMLLPRERIQKQQKYYLAELSYGVSLCTLKHIQGAYLAYSF